MIKSSTTPPFSLQRNVYCARFGVNLSRSFVVIVCKNCFASGPFTMISPMWDTSNNPAFVLVAWCSSLIPVNCTGKSHPPKSIVFAPYFSYSGKIGVLFNVVKSPTPLFFDMKMYYKSEHLILYSDFSNTKNRDSLVAKEISVLLPESCISAISRHLHLGWFTKCKRSPELCPVRVLLPERFVPSTCSFGVTPKCKLSPYHHPRHIFLFYG